MSELTIFWVFFLFSTAAGTKEPQKSSTRGGLIAGIVILLFVIIASVGIGVMYFRWRKGKQQFAAQRFENAPEPKDVQLWKLVSDWDTYDSVLLPSSFL